MPPAATTAAKKTGLTLTALKKERVIKEPIQKFFITHTDKSIVIKYDDMQFGYFDGQIVERNTSAKDSAEIKKILNFIKLLKKSNVAYADIAERLNCGIYSLSIKQFLNQINKEKQVN